MRADVATECPDQTRLLNFINEQLTIQEFNALDAHVSTCPNCMSRLQEIVNSRWGTGTISMLSTSSDHPPRRFGSYETLDVIAVGGMGTVWRVKDTAFDRQLAVKVIKTPLADRADYRARFLREAQLTAGLTHPNIVPVHTQGELEDGRLYYSMKLVEGETLAKRMQQERLDRASTSALLHIFYQVCQAMAFAHRQGVIHRDLKPLNIMVGAHDEVQVMDWGLAKVLSARQQDETTANVEEMECSEALVETTVGDIVGTLAYMPPEQARGEQHLTFAADVFALGAILCEILTGQPVYQGKNLNQVMRQAVDAELTDALFRLDSCAGDPNLIEIARNCLAADPAQRPQDAGALAAQLTTYHAGLEQRLQDERLLAERERGAATEREQSLRLQARWERRRRRLTSVLSLSLLVAMLLASGLAFGWLGRQQRQLDARQSADDGISQVVTAMRADDLAHAEVELRRAQALLDGQPDYRRDELVELNDSLDLARRLEAVRMEYFTWSNAWFDCCTALDRYAYEFQQSNWNMESDSAATITQRVASSPVRHRLLAALDDWAWLAHREALRAADEETRATHIAFRDRLLNIARSADVDNAAANQLRDGAKWEDVAELSDMLDAIEPREHSPELLVLIGKLLPPGERQSFFRRCQHYHSEDFWLNAELGRTLLEEAITALPSEDAGELPIECPPMMQAYIHMEISPANVQHTAAQAVGYYRAALVQHPDVLGLQLDLATATALTGDMEGSMAICQAALDTAPADAPAHELAEVRLQIGLALLHQGQTEAAIEALRAAVELDSYYAAATEQLVHYLVTAGRPADARRLSNELGLALPDGEALEVLANAETT